MQTHADHLNRRSHFAGLAAVEGLREEEAAANELTQLRDHKP